MRYRKPINIVNMKDMVNNNGDVPDTEIVHEAEENYRLAPHDTVAVSSLAGMDALKAGKNVLDSSGFKEFTKEIEERLKLLEPSEALENAVIEYNTTIESHRELNSPLRTVVKRFTEVLKDFGMAARVRQTVEKAAWHQDMFY
jgi:exonuclease VII small subunit